MFDRKTPFVAALLVAGALFAGSAQASRVNWSVSVNLPPVTTVVSNGSHYHPQPVYYPPAPVYVQPAPVYYQPPPVVVHRPPVVVYRPEPEIVGGRFVVDHRWHHRDRREWREERRHRHEHRREYRDEYGDRWDSRGNH